MRIKSRISNENGATTLIELLVTIPAAILVLIAVTFVYNGAVKSHAQVQDRSHTIVQSRIAVDKMNSELQQATSITPGTGTNSTKIVAGQLRTNLWVRYDCTQPNPVPTVPDTFACTRATATTLGGLGTGAVIVTGVNDSNVFSYFDCSSGTCAAPATPADRNYMKISLKAEITEFTGTGKRNAAFNSEIQLDDGFEIRNTPFR